SIARGSRMAYFSPTIAAKRTSRSGAGVRVWRLSFIGTKSSAREVCASVSCARGGRAPQAVVDRLAQALRRHRHDRDRAEVFGIERAQMGKQVGGRLDQIAAG